MERTIRLNGSERRVAEKQCKFDNMSKCCVCRQMISAGELALYGDGFVLHAAHLAPKSRPTFRREDTSDEWMSDPRNQPRR